MHGGIQRQAGRSDALWLLLGLALGAAGWLGWKMLHRPPPPPELESGFWLEPAKAIGPFVLVDHQGEDFTPRRLEGQWSFVFFGYTHCPDVCPMSMTMLGEMMMRLAQRAPDAPPPQVIFVSVDPERDTVEELQLFVPYFHPDFVGLTGDPAQIERLTAQLGILHQKSEPDPDSGGYLVDHSAAILLFDPEGRFAALFGAPHLPDKLADDYLRILKYRETAS